MSLAHQIDQLVSQILVKAENQHELLIGACQSEVKLTNTQEHILMLLSEEKMTNTDLARALKVSQAAVTKAVKSLVNQGLLESTKDTLDARMTYFTLTEAALPIAHEHSHHHSHTLSVYDDVLEAFTDQEKAVLARFVSSLSEQLHQH